MEEFIRLPPEGSLCLGALPVHPQSWCRHVREGEDKTEGEVASTQLCSQGLGASAHGLVSLLLRSSPLQICFMMSLPQLQNNWPRPLLSLLSFWRTAAPTVGWWGSQGQCPRMLTSLWGIRNGQFPLWRMRKPVPASEDSWSVCYKPCQRFPMCYRDHTPG